MVTYCSLLSCNYIDTTFHVLQILLLYIMIYSNPPKRAFPHKPQCVLARKIASDVWLGVWSFHTVLGSIKDIPP